MFKYKFDDMMLVVRDSLQFAMVEAAYLCGLLVDLNTGDGVSAWYMWLGAILAVGWVIVSSFEDATATAKEMILEGTLFQSDFIMSTLILVSIGALGFQYAWWFSVVILLAVGQNLRYIYMSYQWILEYERERQRKSGHSDDHM